MRKEDLIIAGNKIYMICPDCDKLVRINKPIIGSFHICLTDEEIEAKNEFFRITHIRKKNA